MHSWEASGPRPSGWPREGVIIGGVGREDEEGRAVQYNAHVYVSMYVSSAREFFLRLEGCRLKPDPRSRSAIARSVGPSHVGPLRSGPANMGECSLRDRPIFMALFLGIFNRSWVSS